MLIVPTVDNHEFQAILNCTAKLCLKNQRGGSVKTRTVDDTFV